MGLGFEDGERGRVADLHWEAFRRKLGPAFADEATGRDVVRAGLRGDRVLVARLGGEGAATSDDPSAVVGICGFHAAKAGALDLTWARLRSRLSLPAAVRATAVLGVLAASDRPGVLVLDGLCVAPEQRGRGIGTALLDAAGELARGRGLRAVGLSVVDTNPRAEALYRRLGFRSVRRGRLGPLAGVYGFDGYAVMEREVA